MECVDMGLTMIEDLTGRQRGTFVLVENRPSRRCAPKPSGLYYWCLMQIGPEVAGDNAILPRSEFPHQSADVGLYVNQTQGRR
jgi:hypothetical protein